MHFVLIAAALFGAQQPDTAVGPQREAKEGVYTKEQAEWGAALFEQDCARCHSHREFGGDDFREAWVGRTAYDLYSRIFSTMPLDQPAGLSGEQYVAIVAYILEINGYPTGAEALGSSKDELTGIRIRPAPRAPGRSQR
jgi:mono/diheme cytochrome c family protein